MIRQYGADDLPAVLEVFTRSVHETCNRDYTPEQLIAWAPESPNRDSWKERFSTDQTWVYETSGQISGFMRIEEDGHIDLLYVHPQFQRQGIATALLNKLQDWASAHRVNRLYTEASITARPFFERSSFRVVQAQQVKFRGIVFDNFVMERQL